MYLALCTPENQHDEFLLSENLFSIHEGPTRLYVDAISREEVPRAYTEYHVLAAISPRLMIVLRSNLLPNAEEDMFEEFKNNRQILHDIDTKVHAQRSI